MGFYLVGSWSGAASPPTFRACSVFFTESVIARNSMARLGAGRVLLPLLQAPCFSKGGRSGNSFSDQRRGDGPVNSSGAMDSASDYPTPSLPVAGVTAGTRPGSRLSSVPRPHGPFPGPCAPLPPEAAAGHGVSGAHRRPRSQHGVERKLSPPRSHLQALRLPAAPHLPSEPSRAGVPRAGSRCRAGEAGLRARVPGPGPRVTGAPHLPCTGQMMSPAPLSPPPGMQLNAPPP